MKESSDKPQNVPASNVCPSSDVLPGLTVRWATSADCDVIFELIVELACFEKLAHEVVGTREELRKSVSGPYPQAEVLLAQVGDETAGFCLFYSTYSTFLTQAGVYIEDLYVRPLFRRHGIGTHLMAKLAAVVEERGWGRMEWSVLDWNRSALDFYRSLAAREVEEWRRFRIIGEPVAQLAKRASHPIGSVRPRRSGKCTPNHGEANS